jgi:hypothetical protein
MRHAVQQLRQMSGEIGVPRMAVHKVRTGDPGGHGEVDTQSAQSLVGAGEFGWVGVTRDPGLGTGRSEAVHPYVGKLARRAAVTSGQRP